MWKKEKIEDDRNYEKQKLREKEKEKKKLKEDDYDINNLVDNFNNVNIDNFKKKETKKQEINQERKEMIPMKKMI